MRLLWILLLCPLVSFADYGWIPNYKNLNLRTGWELYESSENFDENGLRTDYLFQSQVVKLFQSRFWAEAEYGFSDKWAFLLRAGLQQSGVKPKSGADNVLEEVSAGDVQVSVKWEMRPRLPVLTLETKANIPTYGKTYAVDEMSGGQGSFDIAFKLHTGYRMGRFFTILTPGLNFRFGGYAQALTLEGGFGFVASPMYGLLFFDIHKSFTDELLLDSALNVHDANGTGGSYARLAGSPSTLGIGFKLGGFVAPKYAIEMAIFKTTSGNRAPNFFTLTINVRGSFNFFKDDKRKILIDVPFDKPQLENRREE